MCRPGYSVNRMVQQFQTLSKGVLKALKVQVYMDRKYWTIVNSILGLLKVHDPELQTEEAKQILRSWL